MEREGELSCSFKYATELYEAVAIRRMMQNFQCLLESIVAQPQHRLSDLPLLAEIERKQVLFAWNATHSPLSEPHCLHDLFEQQVARTPEAIAVTSGDQQLSYQELNERANQLAHSLRTLGCAPEVPVGLYLERSLYLMIGVLGVLKAGGAYLPLDPTYPRERLAWILADAQVPILLTQTTLLSHLPEHNSTVVCLDDMMARYNQSGLTGTSTTNPLPLTTDMHLAYIIYTSGSTGQPKGVLVTHRSVVNHSLAIAKQYALHCSDRVLQFASLSFDAAGEEIYPTWLSGATLVLRPEHLPATPDALHSYILRTGLTVLNLPTAYWHQWVTDPAMPSEPLPTSLRLVIVGGEQVQSNSYRHWLRSAGTQIQWSNTYGPTEATITAILHVPEGYEEPHLDPPPIGRPIANVQAYVLDQQLQPVPIGAIGEIYLGGTGLARGYLNRPDLTAECFIPNPYGPAGTRLYRTGDLARYLTDGNLLYVSRGDRQVKIRGYRIELAEVESHLLRHPAVSECVVVARADALGATSLIAYIITRQAHVSTASLRQFLGTHLPAYALPTNYVFLEHFPRTASGKIDQRALPVPGLNHQENTAAYVPPETPVEEVLVNLWCEVLKLSHVGIHDHFLELGGHSLLAMQIAFRVHQIFRIEIPLHMFFQVLTVAKLAEHITLLGKECGIDVIKIAQLMIKINAFSDTEVKALLAESKDIDRLS